MASCGIDKGHKTDLRCDWFDMPAYKIAEWTSPSLHGVGITPNMVTVARTALIGMALYALWQGNWAGFAFATTVNYVLDTVDGYLARKYGNETVLGDYMDHAADVGFLLGAAYVLHVRYSAFTRFPRMTVVGGLLLATLMVHAGCTQRRYRGCRPDAKDQGNTLDWLPRLCASPDSNWACAVGVLGGYGPFLIWSLIMGKKATGSGAVDLAAAQ